MNLKIAIMNKIQTGIRDGKHVWEALQRENSLDIQARRNKIVSKVQKQGGRSKISSFRLYVYTHFFIRNYTI